VRVVRQFALGLLATIRQTPGLLDCEPPRRWFALFQLAKYTTRTMHLHQHLQLLLTYVSRSSAPRPIANRKDASVITRMRPEHLNEEAPSGDLQSQRVWIVDMRTSQKERAGNLDQRSCFSHADLFDLLFVSP
jgi:hypothetical protein